MAVNRIKVNPVRPHREKNQVLSDRRRTLREIAQLEIDFGIGQRPDLVNVITALNSNCLTKQIDSRIALVTVDFLTRLPRLAVGPERSAVEGPAVRNAGS